MILIDGLECSIYDREIFQELRAGGLDCITNTIAFWESASETMDTIGRWRAMARENADLIMLARSAADIEEAHRQGRTAVLMGAQNSSLLDDRLRWLELFADMGLRVMQLTYNNQNSLGGSCYEQNDSGLSRFGREVVREMNNVGVLVDLSHVGERTGIDAIEWSERPVAVTHANPRSLYEHVRNKGDDLLRALAANGGVLGLATYVNIGGPWCESLDRWCEMVLRTIDLIGIDHVGIGTDLGRKETLDYLNWMRMGRWTRTPNFGAGNPSKPGQVPPPDWFRTTAQFPDLVDGLRRAGLGDAEVDKVAGGNWMRLYEDVFRS